MNPDGGDFQCRPGVEQSVVREASSVAALYRDVSSYPEPDRQELQSLLREYTRYVIEEAWPLQQKGIIPPSGTDRVDVFHVSLMRFEPKTKGQEIIYAETIGQFNKFIELRRMRLYQVETGIPAILWYTVGIGALINALLIWMFEVRLPALLLLGCLVRFMP